ASRGFCTSGDLNQEENTHENSHFSFRPCLSACLYRSRIRSRCGGRQDEGRLSQGWRHVGCQDQHMRSKEDVISHVLRAGASASVGAPCACHGSWLLTHLTTFEVILTGAGSVMLGAKTRVGAFARHAKK